MQKLSLVFLALLVGAAVGNYCNSGGDFPGDCKDRQSNRDCLLSGGDSSEDSSDKSSANSGSSESHESKTTLSVLSSTDVTIQSSTYGECSCSCENSGSDEGSGSGSYESSGSGSEEGSGSGLEGGSGSGAGGSFGYGDYCLLLQYFYNISIEIEDVEIRQEWILFIEELQLTVIFDKTLTIDEKLVLIYTKLQAFLEIHVEIQELVYYTYIEEWSGYVFDLEAVVLFIQYQYTSTIVELDASGSCILFEALRNCTAVDAEFSARIEVLIEELTVILESTSYTYSYQLVLIYEKIEAFFAEYSEYEAAILAIEIEGYGSFASFYEVIVNYWRVANYEVVVGGSASSCALIQVLTECYENTSSGSISQRSQIKQLVEKLTAYFESEVSVELRVSYFVEQSYQFLILNQWSLELIFSLEIDGFGSIYELILAFSFEKDCGGFDFGSQTTTPAIESTTEAVESTTHATGDCSVVLDIIKFQNNITDLSWSIDQAQLSWNQTEITRFSAYEKRIYTVTSNTTATSEQIFENVVNVFNVWTKDQFYLSLTYDIVIQIYHETAEQYTWGTVKQFCACA
ncbi:unnamed protein product [Bursaphelenchus xylophilus]|uniref:(pine wood nematode) hypothetical protein n=1 Tax=Bursaphelenchus xylophilus TaxID=6326 RepID=A0A7I8WV50_BURXY|nr:unnamed protein product [Bursaphelenchus xylophilus]CAG9117104.1 unnamed protein product [Bursaphelenchus xylophilus]